MATTKYLWDDETDTVVMEKDGSGTTKAVYHTDPVPYGRLFSMRRDGKTYNYRYDAQGNTRALTDETGKTTDTYTYTAFGTPKTTTGTTTNPYRYGGQHGYQHNESIGDYYIRARAYQPVTSRWLSKDPLRFVDGTNLYKYAINNPVIAFDLSGYNTLFPIGRCKCKGTMSITPKIKGVGTCLAHGIDCAGNWTFEDAKATKIAGAPMIISKAGKGKLHKLIIPHLKYGKASGCIVQKLKCIYSRKIMRCLSCSDKCLGKAIERPNAHINGIQLASWEYPAGSVNKESIFALRTGIDYEPPAYKALRIYLKELGATIPRLGMNVHIFAHEKEKTAAINFCKRKIRNRNIEGPLGVSRFFKCDCP